MSIGALLTFPGLGALLSFSQMTKHDLYSGRLGVIFGMLTIPVLIALMWKIIATFGWWTIAIFIIESLIVGYLNMKFIRAHGMASLVAMQPFLGLVFTSCAVLCWFL